MRVVTAIFVLALSLAGPVVARAAAPIARVAVLTLDSNPTNIRVTSLLEAIFRAPVDATPAPIEFAVIDSDLARAAAMGSGYRDSLNLDLEQARDLGAAIGCDFYFLVNAQVVRRLPADNSVYFDAFATIFLVSTRTGKLIFWERPAARRDAAEESEKSLLAILSSPDTRQRYLELVCQTRVDERSEIVSPIRTHDAVIDMTSDEQTREDQDLRPPRPFRRFKPLYPESAAQAEVEATIDAIVDLDQRGEVRSIEIARWAGFGLDQSVTDTIKQMHFFPALRGGVAVPVRVLLRYNFRKPPLPDRKVLKTSGRKRLISNHFRAIKTTGLFAFDRNSINRIISWGAAHHG